MQNKILFILLFIFTGSIHADLEISDLSITAFSKNQISDGLTLEQEEIVFTGLGGILSEVGLSFENQVDVNSDNPQILDTPLNYPNPFKFSEGTSFHYTLNTDADIECRIYNIAAREVLHTIFAHGADGGSEGHNIVPIEPRHFKGQSLPSGLYYFLLINEKKVLGKGKMLVVP